MGTAGADAAASAGWGIWGDKMGMNAEQKMAEKFMSWLEQEKPIQGLPEHTWRTGKNLMMSGMKPLLQGDCHK